MPALVSGIVMSVQHLELQAAICTGVQSSFMKQSSAQFGSSAKSSVPSGHAESWDRSYSQLRPLRNPSSKLNAGLWSDPPTSPNWMFSCEK